MKVPKITKPAAPAVPKVTVSSRAEADEAVLEYARRTRLCERLQRELNETIEFLHGLFHREYLAHEAHAKACAEAVIDYARQTLDAMNVDKRKPVKSLALTFARVKFSRDSDRVVVSVKGDELAENLRAIGREDLIQSREFVESDDLRSLGEEMRERVGVSIVPTPVTGAIVLNEHSLATLTEFATT